MPRMTIMRLSSSKPEGHCDQKTEKEYIVALYYSHEDYYLLWSLKM